MLSGVFFDLDETLIDADGCHREASRRAFAAFGMDWDEALSRTGPFFGRRMREILEARRNALGVDELAAPVEELSGAVPGPLEEQRLVVAVPLERLLRQACQVVSAHQILRSTGTT